MKGKSGTAIIFDTDVDGLLSTVIAISGRYKPNPMIFPSSITELRMTLDNIEPQFKEMLILDIGLNPDDMDVIRSLEKHTIHGTQCIWIDTHPSTLMALNQSDYKGMLCFKANVATATLVQNLFGTTETSRLQQIASIMEKEVQVDREDRKLKEGNALAASIIGLDNSQEYAEIVEEILSNPYTEINKFNSVNKYIEKGQKRIDEARNWLRTTSPIRGSHKKGPAIWKTDEELLFRNVSGKALRASAFKRQKVCVLLMPKSEYPEMIRFKVQGPDSGDADWMTMILSVAERFNGNGGGYKRAFGGWIPIDQEDIFIDEVWDLIQEHYNEEEDYSF